MLSVRSVNKQYKTGDFVQVALNGVSLDLRDNEFVAILGPSGSGKTTLLNIIGGLDRYDSGDLVINGISTKKYRDRDWDSYRNHTVGFVFQSYNLIPHQTVLRNVELALTIGGVSAKKRRELALDALEKVGLREQAHKRPNQMSGGQMQRVAIARALVNNPKILLADEPTGALDTNTSVQVMELLKEVAKDRLVVMVTHNPELADKYATRIVRLRDGRITDDTNPCSFEDNEPPVHKNLGKASMSLLTSFGLSLNNLLTKKGRTILTSLAGSIGIIGIALILSVSTGFQNYIDKIQEDTMTGYPLTITSEKSDVFSAILSMKSEQKEESGENELIEQQYITTMFGSISSNDLKSFKAYLDGHTSEYEDYLKLIKYKYSVAPLIYTIDSADNLAQINPDTSMSAYMNSMQTSLMSSYSMGTFSEIADLEMLKADNRLLAGKWPEKYNEMVAVVADPHQISDLMLYSLGLRDTTELSGMMTDLMAGEAVSSDNKPLKITYEDLLKLELKLVRPDRLYRYNSTYDTYEDMTDDERYMSELYAESESLRIVGVICSEDSNSHNSGVMYMPELTEYIINTAAETDIVKRQLRDKGTDVFSGTPFDSDGKDKELDFQSMINVDEDKLSEAFKINKNFSSAIDEETTKSIVMASALAVANNLEATTAKMVGAITEVDRYAADGVISGYISAFTVSVPEPGIVAAAPALPDNLPSEPETQSTEESMETEQQEVSEAAEPAETAEEVPEPVNESEPVIQAVPEEMPAEAPAMTEKEGTPENATEQESAPEAKATEAENKPEAEPSTTESEPVGDAAEQEKAPEPKLTGAQTKQYLLLSSGGMYLPDVYKSKALSDSAIEKMLGQLGGLKISPENLKKIVSEAFDIYIASLQPDVTGMVPLDSLPSVNAAIDTALNNNKALIFNEGYDLAKEYTSMVIAAGIGEAISQVMAPLSSMFSGDMFSIDTDKFADAFEFDMDEDELSRLMESMFTKSDSTYSNNLVKLGYQDMSDPTDIVLYFKDFESKGSFADWVDQYNEGVPEEKQIKYTDITGLLMGSVETIINSVTYVLIAFVSISLVVSSIMIGIITYISVLERTKEIGILRAIGASKRNISSIFNAETFIIGMISGVLGVGISYALLIPINSIIHKLTENEDITAVLDPKAALALVGIATVLTIIGGLIPSSSASRKDPVIALRTD